nr:MAG TPA: hypothetical protein [Caudoviricetes sp.]
MGIFNILDIASNLAASILSWDFHLVIVTAVTPILSAKSF